jgi:predicted small metal-binding protein
MDLSSAGISTMVFKRLLREDQGDFLLDQKMLTVFMELDGQKNLGAVASKAGLNMSSMREVISKLLQLKLIEKVEENIHFLDNDFIEYLFGQFSLAVGPIAQVLIEDETQDLGFSVSQFPIQRIAELVDRLSREIRRDEKKTEFKRNMINKIREKGYLSR